MYLDSPSACAHASSPNKTVENFSLPLSMQSAVARLLMHDSEIPLLSSTCFLWALGVVFEHHRFGSGEPAARS